MATTLTQSAHASNAGAMTQTVALSGVGKGHLLSLVVFTGNGVATASVTDSQGNPWIRNTDAYASGSLGIESWNASGAIGGNTTVTVTLASASATDFTLVLMEFTGPPTVNAMDQENANAGTSAHPQIGFAMQGFQTGELFIGVAKTSVAVTSTPTGFTTVATGTTGDSVVYLVDSGTSSHQPTWGLGSSVLWLALGVSFCAVLPGTPATNTPGGNMPQVQVEISADPYPFTNNWRNVTRYVRSFKTTLGRQHELDRIEAGTLDIVLDGRDGTFDPWNTSSFLSASGTGMQPMNAVRVTAAWQGVTYPVAWCYLQSLTPGLDDQLNVEVTLHAVDAFQFLSLRYLAGDNYAQLIEAESTLCAYWRCGDSPGQDTQQSSTLPSQLKDSTPSTASGYGPFPGQLLNGTGGLPLLGATPQFVYDPSTSLDLSNATNAPNGGFATLGNPLGSASAWTFEAWIQYLGAQLVSTTATSNTNNELTSVGSTTGVEVGWVVVAADVPNNTTVTAIVGSTVYMSGNATGSNVGEAVTFAPRTTLLSAGTTAGALLIQVGAWTSGAGTTATTLYGRLLIVVGGFVSAWSGSSVLLDGSLHHVIVTYDGNFALLYIDGAVDAVWTWSIVNLTDLTGILVGCSAGPSQGFAGLIQDVALYSSALSGADIASHYTTGYWFQGDDLGASNAAGASARLNKVLAVAAFPAGLTAIGTPFKTSVYGETQPVTTTTALDYVQLITETEPGLIFQGQDGNIYALNRQYVIGQGGAVGIMNSARAYTSQGIFGDTAACTYRFVAKGFALGIDDLDVWNDIQAQSARPSAANDNGKSASSGNPIQVFSQVQDARMAVSASQFGDRTLQGLTSLLFLYDSDALLVAEWYGVIYAAAQVRPSAFTLDQTFNLGANLPQMLGRTLYDQITVEYQGMAGSPAFSPGSEYTGNVLIESIEHDVDFGTSGDGPWWRTTLVTSPFELAHVSGSSAPLTVSATVPIVLGSWQFGSATGVLTL
jgi:hypothetical protein